MRIVPATAKGKHRPRRPVVVSQLRYPLPDGSPDPQAAQDCGESCVSSILATASGIALAPGALREALGGPNRAGQTTASDLEWLLSRLGVGCTQGAGLEMTKLRSKVGAGYWVIALGYYQGPNELHWVIAYDYGSMRVWYMDPWVGRVRVSLWPAFGNLTQGSYIEVRDKFPRK